MSNKRGTDATTTKTTQEMQTDAYFVTLDKRAIPVSVLSQDHCQTLLDELQFVMDLGNAGIPLGISPQLIENWYDGIETLLCFVHDVILPLQSMQNGHGPLKGVDLADVEVEVQEYRNGELIDIPDGQEKIREEMIQTLCVLDSMKQTYLTINDKTTEEDVRETTLVYEAEKEKDNLYFSPDSIRRLVKSAIAEWHKALKYILLQTCITCSQIQEAEYDLFLEQLKKVFFLDRFMTEEEALPIPQPDAITLQANAKYLWIEQTRQMWLIPEIDRKALHKVVMEMAQVIYILDQVTLPEDEIIQTLRGTISANMEEWIDSCLFLDVLTKQRKGGAKEIFQTKWDDLMMLGETLDQMRGLEMALSDFAQKQFDSPAQNRTADKDPGVAAYLTSAIISCWRNRIQEHYLAVLSEIRHKYEMMLNAPKAKGTKPLSKQEQAEQMLILEDIWELIDERLAKDGYAPFFQYISNHYCRHYLSKQKPQD